MRILYVASEASPFIKVGGLGDVAGALPKALCRAGDDVRVILPYYGAIPQKLKDLCTYKMFFFFNNSWRSQYCGIFEANIDGVTYYLLDNEYYFNRPEIYGAYDDGERFAFFSRAVLEALPLIDFIPDILHCNDWHTALIPVLLDTQFRERAGYGNIRTVYTIHNIEFQGKYDPYILGNVFGLDEQAKPLLFYGDCLNLMKGAIECSDRVTTVSPRYAQEILSPPKSCGLEHILNARSYKLHGILNGIDTDLFDPAADPRIPANFSAEDMANKAENKRALQQELGLPQEKELPLFGMVTRLTHQKGLDLLVNKLDWLMSQEVQVVVLGTGDAQYEQFLQEAAARHPENLRVILAFDGALAQRIYAACDFFLMPSEFEPCGLAQMIAMRYGTLPIVHTTGGLADTVVPYNPEEKSGRGITFQSFNAEDFSNALWRSIELFHDRENFTCARLNAMAGDYSWGPSVEAYQALYRNI
ncbi:MAG: glycogen synthase GlgA [Clostridia bacterium]|nr:glycogen synthase GlgA [Clostridia bacterium]